MRATDFNTAVFAFGRMNPITIGHAKLIDMVKQQPGKHYLFLTHTQKPKTDPLTFDQKLAFAKDTFDNITVGDSSVKTIIQAMQKLESLGYVNVILVAGSDRVEQFKKLGIPMLIVDDWSDFKEMDLCEDVYASIWKDFKVSSLKFKLFKK